MSKKKNKAFTIELILGAGKANPSPPVGPVLSQAGIGNIMAFCKEFNDATKSLEPGIRVKVYIDITPDKKYSLRIANQPVMSDMLKKLASVKKGSSKTKKDAFVGKISYKDLIGLVIKKMPDMNLRYNKDGSYEDSKLAINSAVKMGLGSADAAGIEVSAFPSSEDEKDEMMKSVWNSNK